MVTSRGTQAASGASGGCWITKAHCLRQRGGAVAHATTEFEVLTSLLFAFQLRPVGSGNGRNTDVRRATVRTCSKHGACVSLCQLQARQAERGPPPDPHAGGARADARGLPPDAPVRLGGSLDGRNRFGRG